MEVHMGLQNYGLFFQTNLFYHNSKKLTRGKGKNPGA
jgi:hypothetical protein